MSGIPILTKSIEIVGLDDGSNGRMCGVHPTNCGVFVQMGVNLKLRKASIEIPVIEKVPVISVENVSQLLPRKRGRPKSQVTEFQEICRMESVTTFKAFIWNNAVESCCVGFVSKAFQKLYGDLLEGRIVVISCVGSISNVDADRKRSRENNGLAMGIIIG